ncbi:MAG: hypothetical protein IKR23_11260 [Lachnospiraceae bacterium]|nr:hypothetical protein [Lachnospiraceae bacterium]
MVYKAKIDTSKYCDNNGVYTREGIALLRSETDTFYEEMSQMRPSVTAGVCVYKGRINEKLQERRPDAYNDIVAFIGEKAYMNTAGYDEELTRFASTAPIYRLEEGAVAKTIYDQIQYIEDFMTIYNEMAYLFRRIMFGLPHEEGFSFIERRDLSVFAVEQLLQEMPVGRKGDVAASLAGFYRGRGMVKEAEYLRRATEVAHG